MRFRAFVTRVKSVAMRPTFGAVGVVLLPYLFNAPEQQSVVGLVLRLSLELMHK